MTGYQSKKAAAQDKLAQPEQEPVQFEAWLSKQHGDPEEIGFLQALRIAYIAGQDSITTPPQRTEQEPVAFLVDGDLYYPEEIDWETLQEQGHTVASLYTSLPQRPWVDVPDEEIKILWIQYRAALPRYLCFAKALLARAKEKNT